MNLMRPGTAALAACLLALYPRAGTAQQDIGPRQVIGNFGVFHKVDPITDARQDMAIVVSADRGHASAVAWGCFERGARLSLALENFTGARLNVIYRFDQEAATNTVVSRMVEGGNLFLLDEDEVYGFSTRAMNAARLVVRAFDADGQPYDYFFDLNGSGRALRSLPCIATLRPPVAGEPAVRKPSDKPR
ncbi:hypothetical protein [Longimicrobium sp.]|uniref:hypothetical protein n=1 Tax=Longimicrobium sp. TaxID=2029185 RepID=UPI002BC20A59|nr:hypothetical protein [Longimicrobium sp.]HSU12475.1 hypothetical protein [Longimicrobium sp.]